MSLFAIGDFHLSGEPPAKPMEVFSPNWENHFEKIRRNWLATPLGPCRWRLPCRI